MATIASSPARSTTSTVTMATGVGVGDQQGASNNNNSSKAEEIRRILSEPTVDLWKLRELALSEGGLVNDSLRKLAWPKLLGLSTTQYFDDGDGNADRGGTSSHHDYHPPKRQQDQNNINDNSNGAPPSLDAAQIDRDISRVTWHILTGNQRSRNFQMKNKHRKRIAQLLKKKQRRLGDYLNLVLVLSYHYNDDKGTGNHGSGIMGSNDSNDYYNNNSSEVEANRLRYYQGFHDVASIILSALGGATLPSMSIASTRPQDAPVINHSSTTTNTTLVAARRAASSTGLTLPTQVLLRLSRSHFRDAMRSDFLHLQSALKLILMPLVAAFDPQLHAHLHDCEMEPYFCLSWVITWFSHDVRDTNAVKRLYDFFIVSHPLMSVYVSVAMMIHPLNRIEVLGTDCDFACVHNALADLPKNSSNVGWKYLPGDTNNNHGSSSGYATGGEDEDDNMSYDASLQDQSIDTEGDDVSLLGLSMGGMRKGSRPRVPFQELMDLSVTLMHKIPPRNLISLAHRYHDQITLQPLLAQASSIALLQPPPSFGLSSHADADWVLRQKMREEYVTLTKKKLNRHQRKNRLKDESEANTSADPLVRFNGPSFKALIASGTGPDGLAEARKLRKKRKMIMRSVAVAVMAVVVALARTYYLSSWGNPTTGESRSQQQLTMDELQEDSVSKLLLDPEASDIVGGSDGENEASNKAVVESIGFELAREVSPETQEGEPLAMEKEVKVGSQVCDNDDGGDDENLEVQGVETVVDEKEESVTVVKEEVDHGQYQPLTEQPMSSSSSVLSSKADERTAQAALLIFVKIMKSFVTMHRNAKNQTLELHLDQLEQHFDYLMAQLMELLRIGWHQSKAGWSKISPVLVNALHIGWHQIRAGWSKIAPAVKKELMLELDGNPMEWAEDAVKTWKKQEIFLKNHGKFIHSVVSDARKRVMKEGLRLKDQEQSTVSGR